LIDEATRRLSGAVARARGQDYSWAEIADLLGVTRASAWQRYAGRNRRRPDAGRGQDMNGGVKPFLVSEVEPDQRDISTRSTASFSACKLSIKHREGGELTG